MKYILPVIIVIVAILVMIGWFSDISVLKSLHPDWVTMKFTTAASFLLLGLSLGIIDIDKKWSGTGISMLSLLSILLVTIAIVVAFINPSHNFATIGSQDTTIYSIGNNIPSIGTLAAFVFAAFSALAYGVFRSALTAKMLGIVVIIISSIAILGYVYKDPSLYYYSEGVSTAMALHTAILFLIAGIFLSSRKSID